MQKHIVIIGGGFAGLNLAMRLSRKRYYRITLADRNNYNYFPPLVYQVATGFLETSSICYPFRKLFRKRKNIHFRLGTLVSVDPAAHVCLLDNGEISYDYLVFATGAESNFFGNKNIEDNAIAMKQVTEALAMRNRLLQTFERAAISTDPDEKKRLLTIVVAGGGPTGVEISGVLAELRRNVFRKDYPELKDIKASIYLVDGGSSLLAKMSKQSGIDAHKALTELGVKIKLKTIVRDFSNDRVLLSDGEVIETANLIWAAGIMAKSIEGIPLTSLGPAKRMIVDPYNRIIGVPDIFAIGDVCIQRHEHEYPDGHPQLAQIAIQQGRTLARNLIAEAEGKALTPFAYFDKGTMAIIGRNKAVADFAIPRLHMGGFMALLAWLFIHVTWLINYRNRVSTLLNWIIAYLTKDLPLRMIMKPATKKKAQPAEPATTMVNTL